MEWYLLIYFIRSFSQTVVAEGSDLLVRGVVRAVWWWGENYTRCLWCANHPSGGHCYCYDRAASERLGDLVRDVQCLTREIVWWFQSPFLHFYCKAGSWELGWSPDELMWSNLHAVATESHTGLPRSVKIPGRCQNQSFTGRYFLDHEPLFVNLRFRTRPEVW